MLITESGLQYEDVKPMGGQVVRLGHTIRINYKVALSLEQLKLSSDLIDSSNMHEDPIVVTLGKGELLKGLEEGIIGMGRGDTRRFILPPHLAFNKRGVPGIIPENATLFIDINVSTKV